MPALKNVVKKEFKNIDLKEFAGKISSSPLVKMAERAIPIVSTAFGFVNMVI
jgi:hypothetical protein